MHGLAAYFTRILACLFLFSVLKSLFHTNKQYGLVQLAGGLCLILVILAPLRGITAEDMSRAISKIQLQEFVVNAEVETLQQPLMKELIQEKTKTYILDKARELRFEPRFLEVTISDEGPVPYPTGLTLRGMYTQMQRLELSKWIESTLAIPQDAQTWIWE